MKHILFLFWGLSLGLACEEVKQEKTAQIEVPGESSVEESLTELVEEVDPFEKLSPQIRELLKQLPDTFRIDGSRMIQGDFNANGDSSDLATTFVNLENGKMGVLILHNKIPLEFYYFGGGKSVKGMDDLGWIGIFESMPKGDTIAPTKVDGESGDIIGPDSSKRHILSSNGIFMHVDEGGGGGILYWENASYKWMHIE